MWHFLLVGAVSPVVSFILWSAFFVLLVVAMFCRVRSSRMGRSYSDVDH